MPIKVYKYLHEPVEIVIDRGWISIVDFNDRRKFFGRHQYLVFVEDDASEIDSPIFKRETKE